MSENGTKEAVIEFVRNAPEKEKWAWLAGELYEVHVRMKEQDCRILHLERSIPELPCREWHETVIRWLTGLVLTVGALAIVYVVSQVLKGVQP